MERLFDRMGKLGFGLLASGVFMSNFVFVVEPGHRAIIQNNLKGLGTYVYGEGMHIKVPIRDNVKMFEVRTRPTLISAAAGTKDMQIVNVTMRVLFRPVEQELSTILLKLGADYDNRVVPSISMEVLKTTCAQYTAEQLISLREKVSKEIKEVLLKRAMEQNIIIDDISLTDLQFQREFMDAIEQKQVAQQRAEMEKFHVQRREEEAKVTMLLAEAHSTQARLMAEATENAGPGLVAVRKIEAAIEIANNLQRSRNVTFLTGNQTMNMLKI